MNDLSDLERAIAVAEVSGLEMGYDIIMAAAKRTVRASRAGNACPSCGIINSGAHYCMGRKMNQIQNPWAGTSFMNIKETK